MEINSNLFFRQIFSTEPSWCFRNPAIKPGEISEKSDLYFLRLSFPQGSGWKNNIRNHLRLLQPVMKYDTNPNFMHYP